MVYIFLISGRFIRKRIQNDHRLQKTNIITTTKPKQSSGKHEKINV